MVLYARGYTTPFLLDTAIKNNIFNSLVDEVVNAENERILWEIYLQNLPFSNESFAQFKQKAIASQEVEEMPTEFIVERSRNMLKAFNLKEVTK